MYVLLSMVTKFPRIRVVRIKIEKVPRGIRGEKSSKDMESSRNLVSTRIFLLVSFVKIYVLSISGLNMEIKHLDETTDEKNMFYRINILDKRKGKISGSVLRQKPLHQQKNPKSIVTT